MNEERRRRKRVINQPIEEVERESEIDLVSKSKETEERGWKRGIDEIYSEFGEERRSGLLESDYWDETHSWGSDDEVESDEYWHFVGRYE